MTGKIYIDTNIINGLVLLSILRFCLVGSNLNDQQCANYNEICNLINLRPCCDENLSCNFRTSQNGYSCGPKRKLGSPCRVDEDCSMIHAKCSSEFKCVCREKNIEVNEISCMPFLGAFCWKNETCATDNSICVDNQCQCRDYYRENGNLCLPIAVNHFCSNDTDCVELKWSECSNQGVCTCRSNTIPVKDYCVPQLNVYCNLDSDCRVKNSKCIQNKCQCKKNYLFRFSECVTIYLFESCEENSDCDQIRFAECSITNKCDCKQNFIATDRRSCKPLLGEICIRNDDCQALNSECDDNECVCREDYFEESTSSCIPTHLGQICKKNNDCKKIKNAECINMECVCKSDYVSTDPNTCLLLLGRQCTNNSDCAPDNAICFGGLCDCEAYFIVKSEDKCLPTMLQKNCKNLFDCKDKKFSFCAENKICTCTFNYMTFNGTECEPLLRGECSNTHQCMVDNSICVDNRCQCMPDFSPSSHTHCIPNYLGGACNRDFDCINLKNSKCINEKCYCLENHSVFNSTICFPLLGAACRESGDCYVENSICLDEKCQCKTNYFQSSKFRCDLIILGRACTKNSQCNLLQNAICVSNVCVCRRNHFAFNKISCVPVLNRVCSKNSQCSGDFFHCLDGRCQCTPGFTAVSLDKCVRTESLFSCSDTTECSDIWHSECSTGKCVCKSNNIAIGNSTCLPILHGYCWRDDQCTAESSACIDYRCACKPGFTEIAVNSCAPIISL